MADLTATIETLEHRWMRAWVSGDLKAMKAITAKNFILLTGTKPPAILDRPSWIEAAAKRYQCSSYRFGDVMVRDLGGAALFSAPMELKATMDGRDWSGTLFVADIWRKGRVRRGWKLVQRILSSVDERPEVPKAIRSLQLWK
jgi:ketosteroid isomerase-like protein